VPRSTAPTRRVLASALLAGAALLGRARVAAAQTIAAEARADVTTAQPERSVARNQVEPASLIGLGLAALLVPYVPSALAGGLGLDRAYDADRVVDIALLVPGPGPLVGAFANPFAPGDRAFGTFVLALDGAAQTTGLVLLVVGLASPRLNASAPPAPRAGWTLAPHATARGLGLAAVGTF
jgi:hypothetical protein